MNIAGTEYSLQFRSFDIFVSGCTRGCKGCFNQEAQSFDYGEPLIMSELLAKIRDNSSLIDTVRIMGGDLLCQDDREAQAFVGFLRLFPKRLELYTGASIDEIPQWCFDAFDAIKYGRYVEELHCDNPLFGSSNQKYIQKCTNGEWIDC